ncbi:MAG: acetate--CoA ligase [Geothrix sp.]|nr:acetate--CoA ligase [Geothrix sp.]
MSEQEPPIYAGKPLIPPTEALLGQAPMTPGEALAFLEQSRRDPAGYWAGIARELEWYSPWDRTVEGGFPQFRYFAGGKSNVSLNCVDRHARRTPDKVAFHWEREDGAREAWTYAQLLEAVSRFASVLKDLGVRKGDRVGVYMANIPEAFVACHACYRIGAIYSVIFAGFSAQAVHERLLDARPKVVVAADASTRRGKRVVLKETLDQAMEGVPSIEKVVVVRRMGGAIPMTPGRDLWYGDLMATARADCPPEPMEANEPGFIIHTSGTSAKPKGLIHAGLGFLVGVYANTKWSLLPQPEDVLWCTADVGWLTFPIWALVGGLAHGATLVAYEGALDWPDAGHFYEVVERLGVSKLFTAPTALRMLRRAGDAWMQGHDLSRLTLISCVGEPLDPDTWYWSRDVLGGGRIFFNNTYGQTETGTGWTSSMVGMTPTKPGSCGHPLPGYQAEVVDEAGTPLPPGELGVLTLTAPFPSMVRDVWGDPDRYVATYFSRFPGRYNSFDASIIDPDGQVWVTGRVDDVINVAAHRIGTMELEAALIGHPDVSEAAVISVPDPVKGELPLAFVVLRSGAQATAALENELIQRIATELGAFAKPQRVILSSTLPRTRSGKIMRRLLRDLAREGQVKGDVSALENPDAIDLILGLMRGHEAV